MAPGQVPELGERYRDVVNGRTGVVVGLVRGAREAVYLHDGYELWMAPLEDIERPGEQKEDGS